MHVGNKMKGKKFQKHREENGNQPKKKTKLESKKTDKRITTTITTTTITTRNQHEAVSETESVNLSIYI